MEQGSESLANRDGYRVGTTDGTYVNLMIGVPVGAAYPVAHMAGHQESLFVLARRSSYSGRQHQVADTEVDSLPQTGAHAHPKKRTET